MKTPSILVVGATGTVGSEVVRQLVDGGHRVRALVRDPVKASRFSSSVEVCNADLAQPETLAPVFAGIEKAFVLSPAVAQLEINAFDAAKRANVRHVVKLSGRGIETYIAGNFIARNHVQSESYLRETGLAWTMIRPGFFASNVRNTWKVVEEGELRLPAGEGRETPIDPRDIAAIAVRTLTTPGHEGKVYEITGPELLSYSQIIEKMSAVVGRPLRYIEISDAAFREEMTAAGMPQGHVDANLIYFTAVKEGRIDTTPTFAEVMGTQPRTFDEYLRTDFLRR